jgi:sortase A
MAFARRQGYVSRRRRRRLHPLRAAAIGSIAIGLFLVLTFLDGLWQGFTVQQKLDREWLGEVAARPAPPVATRPAPPAAIDPGLQRPINGIDFAIRVPRLGYFAAVREGVDSAHLYSGPGHYPTTVWPGSLGVVGVAAHNVYWINFPQLQLGDEIDLETRYGVYRYRVMGSRIVNPDDRTVLVPGVNAYRLTLTTCWPLWAGAFATQRYVIFAIQVAPVPVVPTYS